MRLPVLRMLLVWRWPPAGEGNVLVAERMFWACWQFWQRGRLRGCRLRELSPAIATRVSLAGVVVVRLEAG
eukprot:4327166-Lingulodinium_polyedra.AAC.1